MAEIYESRVPHFLQAVLSSPVGSINRGAQWVVAFENPQSILNSIKLALTYEGKEWQISSAIDAVLGDNFQKTKGCVFAQAIDIPGESLVVNPEGNIQSNAFRRSYVGQGINQLPEMRMTFLDTNVSFTDNFLRPWVLATGNFGMLARASGDPKNYRTNITCYKLGAYSAAQPPAITQVITFFDACCISVANEELNYAPVTSPQLREARFIYNYYSVSDAKDRGNQFLNSSGVPADSITVPSRP
jgi:hypothetical protein